MNPILKLRGSPAFSAFRIEKLKRRLDGVSFSRLSADYWHFVETARPLTDQESSVLVKLLEYGPAVEKQEKGELFVVVPRFGTVSPWASKATDIAHSCGLTAIGRRTQVLATGRSRHHQI